MKSSLMLIAVAMLQLIAVAGASGAMSAASPDGKVVIQFKLLDDPAGAPAYQIDYDGKPIVEVSRLGFNPDFLSGFEVTGSAVRSYASEWTNAFGERRVTPDNYTELTVDLKHSSGKAMQIVLRAYNEGAALRYAFPQQDTKQFKFTGEQTEFRFPAATWAYEEHATEGDYHRVPMEDIQPWCERPLTIEYSSGVFAALTEAGNHRFPRMLLSGLQGARGALVSSLGGTTANTVNSRQRQDSTISIAAGEASPWRVFILGQRPGDLLERNYLLLNLNPPSIIADTSWIHPGKAMRDGALTTESAKAIIDLAPKLGIDYVGFDAHWYGRDDTSDASQVRAPNLDIKDVSTYAKAHGVRVCVYIDARQAKPQAQKLFPLYKQQWGVDAIKIGFVSVGPQEETSWITDVLALAAENQLAVDIHDGYRATGNNRTFPNLLTVEGIQGNEHNPTPEHNCTLPFTRYVGGPGDYTVCYLSNRIQTTHAHQLAMGVVSFSPLQWLYWYDRPAQYRQVPTEMEFWRHMPTVWDETRVIHGKIGEFASIARRSGDDWFVGTINNSVARSLELPLSFLASDKHYRAHRYSDDDTVQTPTRVRDETMAVDATTTLKVPLKTGGGEAIWIETIK